MSDRGRRVRLRQAVLAVAELEPAAEALRAAIGLGEPFRDPGVGEFGLANVVFALGDCFIEIVSPTREGTAAGRHIARHGGDGGYMALFDIEDLEGARERAAALGVRVVWQIDLPDISGTHLHPADMRGAIVSLDRSLPYGTWRWGGPQWTGRTGTGAPGSLAGITVAVAEPATVAARWAHVLGVQASEDEGQGHRPVLELEGARVLFARAADAAAEGIAEIAVRTPAQLPGGAETIAFGGARVRRVGA
jgi:glyoxalase-like protein